MYVGVPIVAPARVCSASSSDRLVCTASAVEMSSRPTTFASPQSITSTSPNSPTMMLGGFRSRWITPREWAKATPSHTFRKISSSSPMEGDSSPLRAAFRISARQRPRTGFIVK